ncbi:MAG: helicase-related protein, partial [Janthinobacterium lividum]
MPKPDSTDEFVNNLPAARPANVRTSVPAAAPVNPETGAEMALAEAEADLAQRDDQLEQHARSLGVSLQKLEGRVVVRIAGVAEADGLQVPYDLVPTQGVLAKPSKWRKLTAEQQMALITQRVAQSVKDELNLKVAGVARQIDTAARKAGVDSTSLLQSLADGASSEPVDHIFDRLRDRLDHAIERGMEERAVERTRESINLAEYPASFEVAHQLPRRFIALLGPTNSGKTHRAMDALAKAATGVYLAPLRLLALENFERLQAARPHGEALKVSLITGEERRIVEDATHVASTVEMLDTTRCVDVAVIDEIQMLGDRDRGAAWTAAVCGAPASTVYLVGALEARRAIEALAQRLGLPLEVHAMTRMAPLEMEAGAVKKLRNLRCGDAVIAFSRRQVLYWRDMITENGFSVATIYGNLSPEVRRAQAARFREGTVDIVVATDAIAMGLNLPIQRVVMTTSVKYNGTGEEEIPASLVRQIAGRAGRYGVHGEGFVAGFDDHTHRVVAALMKEKLGSIPATGFSVAPSLDQLHRIEAATGEESLARLLKRFINHIDMPDGFFFPRISEEQQERALWLDTLPLTVGEKFTLSLVPISSRIVSLHMAWQEWARAMAKGKVFALNRAVNPRIQKNLQEVENSCRMYSAYAWLAYRNPMYFPSGELAQ